MTTRKMNTSAGTVPHGELPDRDPRGLRFEAFEPHIFGRAKEQATTPA